MSICVRRHGQNQDTQLSFKALHQIIRSHHKGTWENPERSDCTIIFILQTYIWIVHTKHHWYNVTGENYLSLSLDDKSSSKSNYSV